MRNDILNSAIKEGSSLILESRKENHELKLEEFKTIQDILPKVIEVLNQKLGPDSESLKDILSSNNEKIDKFIGQINNDKSSEEEKQEMLNKISETNTTDNKIKEDWGIRENKKIEIIGLIVSARTIILLSKQGIKIYKEIKNMNTLSYKFSNGVNNVLKIIK